MIITDTYLRASKRIRESQTLYLNPNDVLTQSAKDYIKSHCIKVIENTGMGITSSSSHGFKEEKGNYRQDKPEHMTHLRGNILVPKTDGRILFRGKIDTLESIILDAQISSFEEGYIKLVDDLEEVLGIAREILASEVKETSFVMNNWLGKTPSELREESHFPGKYFGLSHQNPSYKQGKVVVKLHLVRTAVREAELWCIMAFAEQENRPDLTLALNRLSSLVYILICRMLSEKYDKE